ncbi:hypothetical protein [Alkalinema sp. FACHB-956]|uniref:hypothetical protein n=1 Tax=Alkalinema sp. FACHB-956 TaxID=2692768 RepID=UPI001686C538|nr:hypothetical protein [Alkalinema sp. FACHB-956]MBD2325898.1 hypothetical protein [Alkalinema sp. FACHB-956]
MKSITQTLDLESIHITDQSRFDPVAHAMEIEALAHQIVEAQVLLSVPLVKPIDFENYELISGHLEFHAYLKALEFDQQLPGRITVYIISAKNEAIALKQIALLRPSNSTTVNSSDTSSRTSSEFLPVENILKRLEMLERKVVDQESFQRSIATVLQALDDRVPVPLPMFQAFDRISEPAAHLQVRRNLEPYIGKAKATKLIEQLQAAKAQGHSLATFQAILAHRGKGLISPEKLMEMSDNWQ